MSESTARHLELRALSKTFPGKAVLCSVDLRLSPGTITCLIGGNGSGKTTLFNLITSFLRPDSGSIRLDDSELTRLAPYQINRAGIARTFQDLRLIGKLSVRENIFLALPCNPGEHLSRALLPERFHASRGHQDRQRAKQILSDFFLAEVADQLASEISYGQQKLLTLACCVATVRLSSCSTNLRRASALNIASTSPHASPASRRRARPTCSLSTSPTFWSARAMPSFTCKRASSTVSTPSQHSTPRPSRTTPLTDMALIHSVRNHSVMPGENLIITSGNGSGKSILLKATYGLLAPSNADVEIIFRLPRTAPLSSLNSQPVPVDEPRLPPAKCLWKRTRKFAQLLKNL